MKIHFLGGAGTVTGSKYLLEHKGKRILVDCGLFQGLKQLRLQNWEKFPLDPTSISAVILTHAHLDHSGYIPKFIKEGFNGFIYCSSGTRDLCRILLMDSAMLMEEEAAYANRHRYSKHSPALALYTKEDAEKALTHFRTLGFHETKEIAGFTVRLGRAGHILGAANVRVEAEDGTSIAFSGDIGRMNDPIMLEPEPFLPADYFVVESTYGDRAHVPEETQKFAQLISETVSRHGSILIPSFAVGRAQHLLYCLAELKRQLMIPDVPVFLDSPMATNVTDLYRDHVGEHRLSREECGKLFSGVRFVRSVDESKAVAAKTTPRIIVSASGMLSGGRVLHYLKDMAAKPNNLLLFPGYQAAGTRGAQIMAGASEVKVHGEYVPVRCKVAYLESLSAHADSHEITEWLKASPKPKKCFITHGEPTSSDALRVRLRVSLGYSCTIPQAGECVEL